MKIYEFERADGSTGADYSESFAVRQGRIVKVHEAHTRKEIEDLATGGGHPRVCALAERSLNEYIAQIKPLQQKRELAVSEAAIVKRSFAGRLKWLLTGR